MTDTKTPEPPNPLAMARVTKRKEKRVILHGIRRREVKLAQKREADALREIARPEK